MFPFKKSLRRSVGLFGVIIVILFLPAAFFSPAGQLKVCAETPNNGPQIGVYLNGRALQFDVLPHFQQGTPVFPLRKIFEECGSSVTWEKEAKRVVLQGAWGTAILYPLNPLYSVNGRVYRMSLPPFIEGGRLMAGLDFIQGCGAFENVVWDERKALLHLKSGGYRENGGSLVPPVGERDDYQLYTFVEVLLPRGNRVRAGESFDIVVSAPLVRNIYSFEVSFFYNPEVIKIKDVKNYGYKPQEEFYLKRINNREGMLRYTQTALGYKEEIPPRGHLAVIQAIAFREGAIPFLKENLIVKIYDLKGEKMPVALEEKILYITQGPPPGH